MAELVDASDLGSGERLLVRVRVSPAAHPFDKEVEALLIFHSK